MEILPQEIEDIYFPKSFVGQKGGLHVLNKLYHFIFASC